MPRPYPPNRESAVAAIETLIGGIADTHIEPRGDTNPSRLFVRCNTVQAVSTITDRLLDHVASHEEPFSVDISIKQPFVDPSGFILTIEIDVCQSD